MTTETPKTRLSKAAAALGSIRSEAKAASSRRNGCKGGRNPDGSYRKAGYKKS